MRCHNQGFAADPVAVLELAEWLTESWIALSASAAPPLMACPISPIFWAVASLRSSALALTFAATCLASSFNSVPKLVGDWVAGAAPLDGAVDGAVSGAGVVSGVVSGVGLG